MITISRAIEEIIASTPYLEESLNKGIINFSALAREIKPLIEKRLYKKDVSEAALLMALKRYTPNLKRKTTPAKLFAKIQNITVRSNLIEITFKNSLEIDRAKKDILKVIESKKDSFFNLIQGVNESTIIVSADLEQIVLKHLSEKPVHKLNNLSSITLSLPSENRTTPGVYYSLLKTLAWNNVNLVEIVSNHNEVSLIFDNSSIDKAFSLIKDLGTQKNTH